MEIYSPAADAKAVFFTDDKTEGHMGVSELLLATTINGILFSVLSGQPLLMIGLSGTVLVFEEELYKVWILGQIRMWLGQNLDMHRFYTQYGFAFIVLSSD